jgi:hypothetical protein
MFAILDVLGGWDIIVAELLFLAVWLSLLLSSSSISCPSSSSVLLRIA